MDLFDRDTTRLTLVNIGLGAACVAFFVIVARAIIRDLAESAAGDATRSQRAPQSVGVTMADGGESRRPDEPAGPKTNGRRNGARVDRSHLKRTIF